MKREEQVVIEHRIWKPGTGPHMVTVRDRASGNVLFTDTLQGVSDWLDIFKYEWSGQSGVWALEPRST